MGWPAALLLVLMVFGAFERSALASDPPASLSVRITVVVDPVTMRAEKGPDLRLPHVFAPDDAEAAGETARRLADLVLGRMLRVDTDLPGHDRYGRLRIRALRDPDADVWAQNPDADILEQMITEGWLAVLLEPGMPEADATRLLTAESRARRAQAGHWKSGAFRVTRAEPYAGRTDRVAIVLGRVRKTSRIGNRLHLEFGPDWRRDFTVGLTGGARKAWQAAVDEAQPARLIRVRGWVRWWNGPFMELGDPALLEFLD